MILFVTNLFKQLKHFVFNAATDKTTIYDKCRFSIETCKCERIEFEF